MPQEKENEEWIKLWDKRQTDFIKILDDYVEKHGWYTYETYQELEKKYYTFDD